MAPSAEPTAELSQLPKADGSATFSYSGYTVTAAVNGPLEAPRRDENPFEALVEVIVRPAAGVGGKIRPLCLGVTTTGPETDTTNLQGQLSVNSSPSCGLPCDSSSPSGTIPGP